MLTAAEKDSANITDQAVIGDIRFSRVVGAIIASETGEAGNTAVAREAFVNSLSQSFTATSLRNPLSGMDVPVTPRPLLAGLLANDLLNGANGYAVSAVTLRPDLAPADGTHAGEARITFSKATPERVNIIFEGIVENPDKANPGSGLRALQSFYKSLGTMTPSGRKTAIEDFLFKGEFKTPDNKSFKIRPVVHADSYGNPHGQVRVNSFVEQPWITSEHLVRMGTVEGRVQPLLTRHTVGNSPWMDLYKDDQPDDTAAKKALRKKFQDAFITDTLPQILALQLDSQKTGKVITDIQLMAQGVNISSEFSGFESISGFESDVEANMGSLFAARIEAEIVRLRPQLPFDVSLRHVQNFVEKESCGGCHFQTDNKALAQGFIEGVPGFPEVAQPRSHPFTHIEIDGRESPFMNRMLEFRLSERDKALAATVAGALSRAQAQAARIPENHARVTTNAPQMNALDIARQREALARLPGLNGTTRRPH